MKLREYYMLRTLKNGKNWTIPNRHLPNSINPFHVTGLFIYPLRTSENLWLSNVSRGYRKRPMVWKGLIMKLPAISSENVQFSGTLFSPVAATQSSHPGSSHILSLSVFLCCKSLYAHIWCTWYNAPSCEKKPPTASFLRISIAAPLKF